MKKSCASDLFYNFYNFMPLFLVCCLNSKCPDFVLSNFDMKVYQVDLAMCQDDKIEYIIV